MVSKFFRCHPRAGLAECRQVLFLAKQPHLVATSHMLQRSPRFGGGTEARSFLKGAYLPVFYQQVRGAGHARGSGRASAERLAKKSNAPAFSNQLE
jgi:hypothetical protein